MWNACIVVHHPDCAVLARTLASCEAAPGLARGLVVDNSDDDSAEHALRALLAQFPRFAYRRNPAGNAGFGHAHNLAFRELPPAPLHAVVNPDVRFLPGALQVLLDAMVRDASIVLAGPALFFPDGERQYLCKRYPTLRALFARRFASGAMLKRLALARDADFYEMRDADYTREIEPEFMSGAFMLFRRETYAALGGFDERFFMYLEDCDITLRARQLGRAVYVPDAQFTHEWARGSHRSRWLTWVTIVSAFKLWNKHGWRWRDARIDAGGRP
ncbi:MAG: glycosyltransferase [Burkholderiales bacterium]|nr:glycosyltransferase [Burkholderiales bacterium]